MNRQSLQFAVGWSVLAGIFMLLVPDRAEAVPVFARQMGAPCTMCHVQFPKLNDFGMAFKQNGYRLKGQEGKYVWQKDNLPIAALTSLVYENRDSNTSKDSVVSRENLEFFSAGSVGPQVSYFFDYHFSLETVGSAGEVYGATPGGTFLIFNDLIPDNLLNLRFGVMSNEFLYLSNPRKTTFQDYLAPVSRDFTGLEVNGVHPAGLHYAAGFGNDELVGFDGVDNNLRGYFAWASYSLKGQNIGLRYNAAKSGDPGDTTADPAVPAVVGSETQTQLDGNIDLHHGRTNVILGYYSVNNVYGVSKDMQTNLLVEVIVMASPAILLTGRYETQETETGGAENPGTDSQLVLNVSYFFLPNLKLVTEYSRFNADESGVDDDTVKIGFQLGL